MPEFRSAITVDDIGRWVVTTGELRTRFDPSDRAAAVQIGKLHCEILRLSETLERTRATLHQLTKTCSDQGERINEAVAIAHGDPQFLENDLIRWANKSIRTETPGEGP